ncbi:hypothetical protein E2C01_050007 [Portunus trituberculatus]|uniref:Uncharacterized protein n=1 Tax=Portunus trituberculatus TaxID=210409 RepID=A0A5B7GFH8_PORTR|nr:hypothetical protein [Portunus trituberculatus]
MKLQEASRHRSTLPAPPASSPTTQGCHCAPVLKGLISTSHFLNHYHLHFHLQAQINVTNTATCLEPRHSALPPPTNISTANSCLTWST